MQASKRKRQGTGFKGEVPDRMQAEPTPKKATSQPTAAKAHQQGSGMAQPLIAVMAETKANRQERNREQHGAEGREPYPRGLQKDRQGHQQAARHGKPAFAKPGSLGGGG